MKTLFIRINVLIFYFIYFSFICMCCCCLNCSHMTDCVYQMERCQNSQDWYPFHSYITQYSHFSMWFCSALVCVCAFLQQLKIRLVKVIIYIRFIFFFSVQLKNRSFTVNFSECIREKKKKIFYIHIFILYTYSEWTVNWERAGNAI